MRSRTWVVAVAAAVGCGGGTSTTADGEDAQAEIAAAKDAAAPEDVAAVEDVAAAEDMAVAEQVARSEDAPPASIACLTPCDCPADRPACSGGLCVARMTPCVSGWCCGCGEICVDGACTPPPDPTQHWCMWACECPPGLPWCGPDFKCQAKPPTPEEQEQNPWSACLCGFDLDPMGAGCYPSADDACTSSGSCDPNYWYCHEGTCAFGVPSGCAVDADCPSSMVCRPGYQVCGRKEAL